MTSTTTRSDLAEARRMCNDILGYVQAGQRDPNLYGMVADLFDELDDLVARGRWTEIHLTDGPCLKGWLFETSEDQD